MKKMDSLPSIVRLLAELTVFDTLDFETFLKKLIRLLTEIIPVDSCLIYFYDRENKKLTLIASKKPHKRLIGKIEMKSGEGITGWVADHKKTVVLRKNAYKDIRFKFVRELPEDLYEAFLSVPIVDREGVVGVVNFQNKKSFNFTNQQTELIKSVVGIIAAAFENIMLSRKVNSLESRLLERKIVEKAKGLLMKEKNMNESDAYTLIREEAMKKRKSIREIAEAIVLVYGR